LRKNPDFVKIDVEGSELRVLKGWKNILNAGSTIFLIEVHGWKDPEGQKNPKDVIKFMKKFDYKPINFFGQKLFIKNPYKKFPRLWLEGKIRDLSIIPQKIFYTLWYKLKRFLRSGKHN
jgi:hypothetical protein